jgi:hypothetical protein
MKVPRWLGVIVTWAWLSVIVCPPPYLQDGNDIVLTDEEGNQIRLVQIERIVNDDDLTEEEKRQALEDLGITDDDLIDLLINSL